MFKLIISKPGFFGGTDFSKYQSEIDKADQEGHNFIMAFYFHGKVEKAMGYDIGLCLNADEFVIKEGENPKPGIYDAELVDYSNPLKWYIFKDKYGKLSGLIIDPTDKDDLAYAKSQSNL